MQVQCCVCKKVNVNGAWKAGVAVEKHELSHTYCPACLRASLNAIRQEISHANQLQPAAT